MTIVQRYANSIGTAVMARTRWGLAASAAGLLVWAMPARAAGPVFRNVVNQPFAAVANGPVGAVTISLDDVPMPLTPRDREAAVQRAIEEQHSSRSLSGAVAMVRYLQRAGVINPRFVPRFPRAAVFTRGGQLVFDAGGSRLPSRAPTRLGGGSLGANLTFETNSFLGAGERTALEQLFDDAKPVMDAIYGAPAENITLRVVELPAGTAPEQGGFYIPGNPGEIRLGRFLDVPSMDPGNLFAFLVLLVRAYHNTAMIDFDSWEEGFARCVATKVWEQIRPTYPIDTVNAFVMVPQYDSLNQAPLGTPTFFQPVFTGMLLPRIAMANTAWAKCLAQNVTFLKNFNQAYYAAFSPSLAGDTPALRAIAASVLPVSEGVSFYDWYLRQWVLDTSVHAGQQFYYLDIPLQRQAGDEPDEYSVAMIFAKYVTGTDGTEGAVGGQVDLRYANFDRSVPDFYVPEGNTFLISGSGDTAGLGFGSAGLFPQNVGDTGQEGNGGRVFIDISCGGFYATLLFPYTGPGDETSPNDFYGVLTGATDGQVYVTPYGGSPVVMEVDEGLFAGQVMGGDLHPGLYLVEYYPPGAGAPTVSRWAAGVTFALNLIVDADGVTSAALSAANVMTLMSLPFTPSYGGQVPADPADVLGIASNRLTLAQWRAELPGTSKYRFYPNVSPFAPGLGFWLKPDGAISGRTISGVAPASGQPFVLHIPAGWSNIGFPFNSASSLPVTSLLVATGDPGLNLANALPWATAVTQGVVDGSVYDFQAGRTPETDVATSLQRFKGYWIRCLKPEGCQLIFPAVGSLSLAKATRSAPLPPDDWQLLIAAASGGHSVGVRLAANRMASDAYDPGLDSLAAPAGPGETLSAYVVSSAGALFKDSRSPAAASAWDIEVASFQPYADVTVTWPDLTALPNGMSAFLVDRDAGIRRAMRTTRTYSFNSGADGSTRHLSVEIGPADTGALSLSNIVITSTRGAGAVAIGFELSRAASAGVRVYNIAGRKVRDVIPATEMSRGPNTVTWDLRSDRGTIVPSGSYMCEIKAASSDGQQVRAVRSVFVGR